jgi:hypothetical protein
VKLRFSAQAGGVEGVKVLPLLGGLAFKVCLQCLSKISLKEARFLLPPSSRYLGIPIIDFLKLKHLIQR